MRARYAAIAILAILVALLAGCTLTVTVDLTKLPARTPTPTSTATAQPTATETATATPVLATATATPVLATATATALPPTVPPTVPPTETATSVPPTATFTPQPTLAPTATRGPPVQATPIVNVLWGTGAGYDLDANQYSVIWLGSISPAGGYTQVRLVASDDGVRTYVQVMTPTVTAGQTVGVTLGSLNMPAVWGAANGWQLASRCTGTACMGWTAYRFAPWGQFGKTPQRGDVWPLRVQVDGATWAGAVRWGLPDYAGRTVAGVQVVTTTLSANAVTGGNNDCGNIYQSTFTPAWGTLSWPGAAQINIQNQWDVADWPCYARWYAQWQLPALPAGAQVVSATMTMRHFGNPGYGPAYSADGAQDTIMQVYEVATPWQPLGLAWDNAPPVVENLSRTTVRPIDAACPPAQLDTSRTCRPGVPYDFDVTEAVKRAMQEGRGWASVALYTASGDYHSGKQFWALGSEQPVVSIAYTLGETPAWTPTPSATSTALSTPTAAPPSATPSLPASTPTPTATRQPTATPGPTIPIQPAATATPQAGRTWYVSLTGNDSAAGTAAAPWRTFAKAWQVMRGGDTLLIQDGTYTEPLHVGVEGVTVKAVNDGKVIIDGRGTVIPLKIGDVWPGPINSNITVEGLVMKNGTDATVRVEGDGIVLRRISAYNASTRLNSSIIAVVWSKGVLLEDVISAGTGRKNILIYTSDGVTLRRAYTRWEGWNNGDGNACANGWPAGNGINPYNSKNVTVENVLVTGPLADAALRITANSDGVYSPGMKILGSIAVGAGMNEDGTRHEYIFNPTGEPYNCTPPSEPAPYYASPWGLGVWGQGDVPGPVFRDVLAYGNAGWGFASVKPYGIGASGGALDHATLCNNNRYPGQPQEQGQGAYSGFTVTNSKIAGYQTGEGARLTSRYIDGVLSATPLLPWPMEGRGTAEMGISIGEQWTRYAGACN